MKPSSSRLRIQGQTPGVNVFLSPSSDSDMATQISFITLSHAGLRRTSTLSTPFFFLFFSFLQNSVIVIREWQLHASRIDLALNATISAPRAKIRAKNVNPHNVPDRKLRVAASSLRYAQWRGSGEAETAPDVPNGNSPIPQRVSRINSLTRRARLIFTRPLTH